MKTQTGRKYLKITSVTKDLCSEFIKDSTIGKEIIQSKNRQKISTDALQRRNKANKRMNDAEPCLP